MTNDHSDKDLIKDKLDIVDVIGQSINLTDEGNGIYTGATSAGSKSGRSLNVDKNIQLWNDWASNKGGDVFTWLAYENNLDIDINFPEVLQIAADVAGVTLDNNNFKFNEESNTIFTITTAIIEHYHNCLKDEHRKVIREQWGISDETIDRLHIGFAPVTENLIEVFNGAFHKDELIKTGFLIKTGDGIKSLYQGRIVFPYWKSGKVVYSIARNTQWTPNNKFETGNKYKKQLIRKDNRKYISEVISNTHFYGEDTIRGQDHCIITEGVTDCIMAIQAGEPCISPVTNNFKKNELEKAAAIVHGMKNIIICNDNDDAGKSGAMTTAKFLENKGINVRMIELPVIDGIDKTDLAEYLKVYTHDDFRTLIKNSKLFIVAQLDNIEVSDEPLDNIRAATDFIKSNLNGHGKSYNTTFVENHIKNHFSFTSKITFDLISEMKADSKESVNKEKYDLKEHVGKIGAVEDIYVDEMCNIKGLIIPKLLGDNMLLRDEYITLRDNGEIYIYKDGVYCIDVKAGDAKAIANKILMHKTSVKNVNEGINYVMHKTRIDRDDINCAPFIINMKNGMYDVLNDKLLPHDPKYKSTIQINTIYDPEAKCPAISKFLYELMDPLDVPLVIQFIGYCFVQDVAQQKALLIDGSARNGKSTLIKLITSMIGNSHISGESLEDLSKDRFSTMQLFGKLVNAHPDMPANAIMDTSAFKTAVTETRLTGQGKGKDKIMFDNICTHIFACNKLPQVEEDETAFFRRFIQVTFPNLFDGADDDKDILNKITTESEMSGFFNLCMVGLRALLEHGEYCYLESTESNEKRYMDKSNPVARFFDERTAPSVNDTSKEIIYWGYVEWCIENGLKKLHNNPFWTQVHKQGLCETVRGSTGDRKYVCAELSLVVPGAGDQASMREKNARTSKKRTLLPLLLSIRPSVQGIIDYDYIQHNIERDDIIDVYNKIYVYKETELKTPGRTDEGGKTQAEGTSALCPSDEPSERFPENALFISQRDIIILIRDTIQKYQEGDKTPIRPMLDSVLESGVTFDKYKSAIEHMKKEGRVFEPVDGYYKLIQ